MKSIKKECEGNKVLPQESCIRKIILVFKTHFDIGFTELSNEAIERYRKKMLPDVIQTCESTQSLGEGKQFVWTMPSWPLVQSLKQEFQTDKNIGKARELINNGQIVWHALPFTTHTEFCGLEEFIRGLYNSRKLSDEYGFCPISAKMTDVPGHTAILPSILYGAGVKFLHLGCNPGCMPPDVPRLFYWEGPDGNRILTFYSKGSYGSSLLPPEDWKFPVWLALQQSGDNMGPHSPDTIRQIEKELESQVSDVQIVVGSMDDFYTSLTEYDLSDVPVIKSDLADSWIHGVGTYPSEINILRKLRHDITSLEKTFSIQSLILGRNIANNEEITSSISKIFERCLLFGEHTWGLDVKLTLGYDREYKKHRFLNSKDNPKVQRIESSWVEQSERVLRSSIELDVIVPEILDDLASKISVSEKSIVVFSGLGWRSDALTDMSKAISESDDLIDNNYELTDTVTGEKSAILKVGGRYRAYLKDLPALGYKSFRLSKSDDSLCNNSNLVCDIQAGILENRFYKIQLDLLRGGISSLIAKDSGREMIRNQKFSFGQYRYDVYGLEDITEFIRSYSYVFYDWLVNDLGRMSYPDCKHMEYYHEGFTCKGTSEIDHASITMTAQKNDCSVTEYGNAPKIEMTITIYTDMPYIDLDYRLSEKPETPYIEAGHFIFPASLDDPQIRINKIGSVIDPASDIADGANNALYCCDNWADVYDDKGGIAIIPLSTPLFSVGDQKIYKYSNSYNKEEPTIFFNAFNNSWGTNFPQWIGGDLDFRYRLFVHSGDWRSAQVHKKALETFASPLVGISSSSLSTNGIDKEYPLSFDLIREMEDMEILALKPAESGGGYVMRIREINGANKKVKIKFNKKFDVIGTCSLIETDMKELARDTDSCELNTKPFEIHTLYMKQE